MIDFLEVDLIDNRLIEKKKIGITYPERHYRGWGRMRAHEACNSPLPPPLRRPFITPLNSLYIISTVGIKIWDF